MGAHPTVFLSAAQWRLLLAAWLAWGFDVFDAMLFNLIAPTCIPTLLGLPLGSATARAATAYWIGLLSALLLVGWAVGGILFGYLADRIGRSRTLIFTILLYALGTCASAFAPSISVLIACRAVASLGIGGEFAAGATLIAETVPEHCRVLAGAFLQTASPLGLFMATGATWLVAGYWMPDAPQVAWRYVLALGILPVFVVLLLRSSAHTVTDNRSTSVRRSLPAALRLLFGPDLRHATWSALAMVILGLFTWWSCNAFLPAIGAGLGARQAASLGLSGAAATALSESWKASSGIWFNLGGLVGALLTVPVAARLGRRGLFATY